MDGSPQRGSLHATTLWHSDAAEWAPSTASKAEVKTFYFDVRFTLESGHRLSLSGCLLCAKSGHLVRWHGLSGASPLLMDERRSAEGIGGIRRTIPLDAS